MKKQDKSEQVLRCRCGKGLQRNDARIIDRHNQIIEGECPKCGKIKRFNLSSDTDAFSLYK